MVVCAKCNVEMACAKTGRALRWDRHWCRNGDEYACPVCGARVVADIARDGYDDARTIGGNFLEMLDEAGGAR